MKLIGREQIPNPDSVGDWLRRMGDTEKGQAGLMGLGDVRDVRDMLNGRILRRDGVKAYTLDADATQVAAEKRDARFTYQGGIYADVGIFETPICMYDDFREGNVPPQASQLAFYRACQERIPMGKKICLLYTSPSPRD